MLGRRAQRHSEELAARASRQEALAELSRRALEGAALDELLDVAAGSVARELGVEHVALLELTRDGRGLLARAGVGLPEGVLGGVLPPGPGEPPGPSGLRDDLDAASSRQVPIETRGRRFGWIEVHSRTAREFSAEEDSYLASVARVLGAAGARARHDDLVSDSEARFRELANTTPALMWMTDAEGDVTFVNEGWLRFTGAEPGSEMGGAFAASAHPDDREALLGVWAEASRRREELRCE
jgi:PAS domain-containing protein